MTVVESSVYAHADAIEPIDAELVDVDELEASDLTVREVVDALVVDAAQVVDALAVEVDVVEAELVEAEIVPEPDAPSEPRRHLRVAPDLVGRRRRVRIAAAGAAVAISATLFAVVGFNVELAQHQIQLQKLHDQLQTEQHRYYDLRKEVAERSAPQHIVGEAQRKGLVATTSSDVTVAIPPPPRDNAGETGLGAIHDNAGGSLANLQP